MYNKILKRPMFMRGGMGYSAQGTGITSGMDTPRPRYYGGGTIGGGTIMGNMMGNRTGFEDPEFKENPPKKIYYDDKMEELQTEREEIVKTPEGQNMYDVISSFGAYANMRNPDGSYKTTGEAGLEQAENIAKIRKDRKDLQDAAKLQGVEEKIERVKLLDKNRVDMKNLREEYGLKEESALALQRLQNSGAIDIAKIQFDPSRTATGLKIKELKTLYPKGGKEYETRLKDILAGTSTQKDIANITAALISGGGDPATAAADAILIFLQIQGALGVDLKADGGRAGYQMGTPATGAMPVATETVMEEQTVAEEPQQASVPIPYSEFRAKIPAEVTDEIVQLIYYNENAFSDFAQITTQADVYAFNNKYGVSLVLPMQTEMA
jgi:hypothetical protein